MTEQPPQKREVKRPLRPSKLTEPEFLATDLRDYRPRVIKNEVPAWDFSEHNLDIKD